jgi:glycosyltransferase involved in cell wall biosynthesis
MSVFDGARHLREAVDSVLGQSWRDLELVIVDDGSRDATPEILAEAAARDPRVRVLRREHAGVAASLAAACAAARAPLLARMDADDVALPERLARQVAFFSAHPEVGVLGTGVEFVDARGRVLGSVRPVESHALACWRLLFRPPVGHPTVMARRELVERAGGYDPAFDGAEDYELWTRLARVTRFANLPEPLLRYRVHAQSVTKRAPGAMRDATVRARQRFFESLLGRAPEPERFEWLARAERGSRRLAPAQREAALELGAALVDAMLAQGVLRPEDAGEARGELERLRAGAPRRRDLRRPAPRGLRRLARWLRRRPR